MIGRVASRRFDLRQTAHWRGIASAEQDWQKITVLAAIIKRASRLLPTSTAYLC